MNASTAASKQTLTQALRALQARGVGEHVFADFKAMDPAVILETCRWFDEQDGRVGVGVLVEELRGGGRRPARRAPRHSVADEQRAYGEEVYAWLRANLPDLRGQDPRVLEYVARLDGPHEAHRLAAATADFPHPTAVVAVMHLHRRFGRGSLTVAEHGPGIRAAVRAADERAIADYQAIEARRACEAAQPSRSRRPAPIQGVETSQGRRSAAPPGRSGDVSEGRPW